MDGTLITSVKHVKLPNAAVKLLGATIAAQDKVQETALRVRDKTLQKRRAIASLDHSASELFLTRRWADAGNLNYWLYEDALTAVPATRFDSDLHASLEETL